MRKLSAHLWPFHMNVTWCLSTPTKKSNWWHSVWTKMGKYVIWVNVNGGRAPLVILYIIHDLQWYWIYVHQCAAVIIHTSAKKQRKRVVTKSCARFTADVKAWAAGCDSTDSTKWISEVLFAVRWSDESKQRADRDAEDTADCSELSVVLKSRQ